MNTDDAISAQDEGMWCSQCRGKSVLIKRLFLVFALGGQKSFAHFAQKLAAPITRSRMDTGGGGRNRTGVHGFAGRCITTLLPRQGCVL